jgi:hypothetical protein
VLGQLAGEHEAHRGLDIAGREGGLKMSLMNEFMIDMPFLEIAVGAAAVTPR